MGTLRGMAHKKKRNKTNERPPQEDREQGMADPDDLESYDLRHLKGPSYEEAVIHHRDPMSRLQKK